MYKQKYLKYKQKYLELKNNMKGGADAVAADIDNESVHDFLDKAKYRRWTETFRLLDMNPSLINKISSPKRQSALMQAMFYNDLNIVNRLLYQYNSNIYSIFYEGKSALIYAETGPDIKIPIKKAILDYREPESVSVITRQHNFLDYAKADKFDEVFTLLKFEPKLINKTPANRFSALHQATIYNKLDTVKGLVGAGANITMKNRNGQLASHIASPEIKNYLELTDQPHNTPVYGKMLDEISAEQKTIFLDFIQNYDTEIIRILLEYDNRLKNIKNGVNFTPLHVACKYNKLETVRYLLAQDADHDISDRSGHKPSFYTTDTEILKLLQSSEAARREEIKIKNKNESLDDFEKYLNSIDSISGINLFGISKINNSIIIFLGDNHAVGTGYKHSESGNYIKLCDKFPNKPISRPLNEIQLKQEPINAPPNVFITDLFNYIYKNNLSTNFNLETYKNNKYDEGINRYQTPMRNELLNVFNFNKLCEDHDNYKDTSLCNKDNYLYNYTDFRWYYNVNSFLKVIKLHIQYKIQDPSYIYYKHYFTIDLGLSVENFVKFLNKFKNIEFYKTHCFYLFCFGINPKYINNTTPTHIFTDLKTKYTTYYDLKDDLDINEFFNKYIYNDLGIADANFTLNKIMFEIPKYDETHLQKWKAKTIIRYDNKVITTTRHAKQLIKVNENQHKNLQNYLYEYIDTIDNFKIRKKIYSIQMILIDFYSLCRLLYYIGLNNNKIDNSIKYKNSINIVYGGEAIDCNIGVKVNMGICDGHTRGHNSSLIYYFRKYYFKELNSFKNFLINDKDYLKKYYIPRPSNLDCVYMNNYSIIIGADTNDFNNNKIIKSNIGLEIITPIYSTAINSKKTAVYNIDKIFYSKNIDDFVKDQLDTLLDHGFGRINIGTTIDTLIDQNGSDHLPVIGRSVHGGEIITFVTFNILSLIFMIEVNKYNIFKDKGSGAQLKDNFEDDYLERINKKNIKTFEKIKKFIDLDVDSISLQELDMYSKKYIDEHSIAKYTLYEYLPEKIDGWENHVTYGYDFDNFKKFCPGVGILLNTDKYEVIDRYHIEIQENTHYAKSVYLILIKAQHKKNKKFYILGSIHFCFASDIYCSMNIQTKLKKYIELIKDDPTNDELVPFIQ
tara:strand:+ start:1129 stop:4509 length:3381 start_codon:yes stop_codon:yes gene_type:complete